VDLKFSLAAQTKHPLKQNCTEPVTLNFLTIRDDNRAKKKTTLWTTDKKTNSQMLYCSYDQAKDITIYYKGNK
jgi:hypothetical protein